MKTPGPSVSGHPSFVGMEHSVAEKGHFEGGLQKPPAIIYI